MDNTVKVSLILPSLNVAAYIREAIESALAQTLQEIEIICIDAGSTDRTREIIEEYANKDKRIRIIDSDVRSYGAQVNMGILASSGEYFAVIETDDFIKEEMIEKLYLIALKTDVDFVKADYLSFFTLENGERCYEQERQFPENMDLYGSVICPREIDELYRNNLGFWRGLYKRDFIISNNIFFNDTPGAAYQDIGFKEKVLFKSKKAFYLNEYLYCYRTDRCDASHFSEESMRNTWFEFLVLGEWCKLPDSYAYYKGYFIDMVTVFIYEYSNYLKNAGNKLSSRNYYWWWFITRIRKAVDNKIITYNDFDIETAKKLKLLDENPENYTEYLKTRKQFLEEKISENMIEEHESIVIFGAGFWGTKVVKYLNNNGLLKKVVAFADNNIQKTDSKYLGITICDLNTCLKKYPNALYVIANDKSSLMMREQYIAEGGNEGNLVMLFS